MTQNLNVIKKLIGGKISPKAEISEIAAGEGKIAEAYNERAAVYKDEGGQLYVLSSSCSHMGCAVTWNEAEKTWDCPCHGSRYSATGEVIQSPAVKGLVPLKGTVQRVRQPGGRLASTMDLAPGEMMGIESGGRHILLVNLNDSFYAIGNTCTHKGCTLSMGQLQGDRVQCPCHGSVFNVKTGQVIHGPAEKPEPVYQLQIEGNDIYLLV